MNLLKMKNTILSFIDLFTKKNKNGRWIGKQNQSTKKRKRDEFENIGKFVHSESNKEACLRRVKKKLD